MKKNTLLSIFTFLSVAFVYAQSTATYTVVFESNWSQAAHPNAGGSLPGSAHWSKLVGATHNADITFLEMGSPATTGIKNLAETGNNTVFFTEVNEAITAGNTNNLLDGPALSTSLGSMTINNVITTEEFPLLTLASMIAPSPDWMVAINSISLLDGDDVWVDLLEFDVYPYDAGTDSGGGYTSGDQATNPASVITTAQGVVPFSVAPIGTFTITLESVLGVSSMDDTSFNIFPNPTTGLVTVIGQNTIKSIEVYNVLGTLALSQEVNDDNTQVDLSALSSGAYLVKITDTNANSQVKKVLKQ